MQVTALIVEFLIPGILLMTAFLGIADALVLGKLIAAVVAAKDLPIGVQIAAGIVLLGVAYVLGMLSNLELFRLPRLRRVYSGIALRMYEKFENKLSRVAAKRLSFQMPHGPGVCREARAEAAERLFDEVWGYLRHRFRSGIEEYTFMTTVERLCRGYIIAFPFVTAMVVCQSGALAWKWTSGAIRWELWLRITALIVLVLMMALLAGVRWLAGRLLPFAVEEEYSILALLFLGEPEEELKRLPNRPGVRDWLTRILTGR